MLPNPPYPGFPFAPIPRQYPEVAVARMQASARTFHQLVQQAENLTMKIESDSGFARQLNKAAQVDNKDEVKRLVRMVISAPFHVSYTPDGLKVVIQPQDVHACSFLTVFLCW